MAPHPIPLPYTLAFPPPSPQDVTSPSPCWAPHFMTQERIMFSNPTLSKPRLSPAATMSDDMLSALTPPLHCASVLQPATPPQVVAFHLLQSHCTRGLQYPKQSDRRLTGWRLLHKTRVHFFVSITCLLFLPVCVVTRPGPDGLNASRWYGRLRVQKSTLMVFNDVKSLGQSFHMWHFLDKIAPPF